MPTIAIFSQNRDFTEGLSALIRAQLGFDVCVNELRDPTVVVGDAHIPEITIPVTLPVRAGALLQAIQDAAQPPLLPLRINDSWQLLPQAKTIIFLPKGAETALTDKEINILQCLNENAGEIIDKETLLRKVWNIDLALDTHTLETHIYRLRNKLRELSGDDSLIIASGGGYLLQI